MRGFSVNRRALLAVALLAVFLAFVAARHAGAALVVSREVGDPDAILLLASHEWERLPEVADRAHRAPSALVLLSIPRVVTERNCHRCAERGDLLVRLGVDARRLALLAGSVTNTRDEALAAFDYCRRHDLERLLVVTSPYHTRRTLATFQQVFSGSGIDVGVVGAVRHSPARPQKWWSSGYDRWYVRYEWTALAYYTVRYGIIPWP